MKLREVLDTANASMAAAHKEVVKDEPEHNALQEGFSLGVAYAADKFKVIENAEVYGVGTRKVSVVTRKLRCRLQGLLSTLSLSDKHPDCPEAQAATDAALSMVLGDVRPALAIVPAGENVSEVEGTVTTLSHDIAVLEDEK